MDLTCMTVPDVADLIDRLALVKDAAVLLDRGGLSPVIDLTDDGVMISASWDSAIGGGSGRESAGPVVIEPHGLSVEEAEAAFPAAFGVGPAVMKGEPRQQEILVDDPDVIDLHLMSVSRRGGGHMGADLDLLRTVLDNLNLNDRGIARLVGRDEPAVAERMRVLTNGGLFCLDALAARLEALLACALDDEQVAALEAAVDTGAAEQPLPEPAGGQDAEAPPPDKDAARGAFPDGAQDLSAIQPGMMGPVARGDGSSDQSLEPAAAVAESGGAAAEDPDLSLASPSAEPPAAVTGTAAAVEAPALPGGNSPAGQSAGDPVKPAPWTPEEDAQLIAGIAAGVLAGKSRQAAIYDAADALGRSRQGAKSRASAKMSLRIDRAIATQARAAQGRPADAAPPAAEDAPAPADPVAVTSAAPVGPAAAPRAAKALRPVAPDGLGGEHRRIWDWLDKLPQDAPFDAAVDLEVYSDYDSGKGVNALALTLGLDGRKLVDRYRDITRCICDAKGKPRPELKMKLAAVLRWRAHALAELKAA
jgi:hypothetical protein